MKDPGSMLTRDPREPALLSIVIPLFNEQASIDALIPRVTEVLEAAGLSAEIILVDDGSSDATWDKMVAWRASHENLTLVALSRNFGKEIAITAGLDVAEGDAVVVMDGDLQHPPEMIPVFLRRWREGYDIVYGVRRDRANDGAARRAMSRAFYRVFNSLSNTPITPDAGDFRLMDRKVVEAIRRMRERARFMKGIYSWVGFKSVPVEFDVISRVQGRSSFSGSRLFALAFDGILSFSTAPLRMAVVIGAAIAIVSISMGVYYMGRTLLLGVDVPGFASIIVSTLALSGLILLQLGLMGLYLGRIYEEVKGRPLYLVRDLMGKAAREPTLLGAGALTRARAAGEQRHVKNLVPHPPA
jgi:glycosyltransferase involved in cell wall biosynthesis